MENKIKGYVNVKNHSAKELSDEGEMEWDLSFKKEISYDIGYGTSALFRNLQSFDMYCHAQGIKTIMAGYVIYNNQKYIVSKDTCYEYSDKNWGRDFTSPLVWLSSWDLVGEISGKRLNNSAFEIGEGRPHAFWYKL